MQYAHAHALIQESANIIILLYGSSHNEIAIIYKELYIDIIMRTHINFMLVAITVMS